MTAVVNLATERVRRQFQASVDLLDFAETVCGVGSAINSAGRHLMMLHEIPTPHMLDDIEWMAMNTIRMVNALRCASVPIDLPPCDTERAE